MVHRGTRTRQQALDVGWAGFVDEHADQVWQTCLEAGLDPESATAVCEVSWARLADRVHAADPRQPVPGSDLRAWLHDIVATEVRREQALEVWRTGVVDLVRHEPPSPRDATDGETAQRRRT